MEEAGRLTSETKDSLMKEVTMVLLPTPSVARGGQRAMHGELWGGGGEEDRELTVTNQENADIPSHDPPE